MGKASPIILVLAVVIFCWPLVPARADTEITLFDGSGDAVAYIATDDGMTIYLWSGEPVAYLEADSSGSLMVYGFNGKHLGWFSGGAIWDHSGAASCAVKERIPLPHLEPIKGIRRLTPLKRLQQLSPLQPILKNAFGNTPCRLLLGLGAPG